MLLYTKLSLSTPSLSYFICSRVMEWMGFSWKFILPQPRRNGSFAKGEVHVSFILIVYKFPEPLQGVHWGMALIIPRGLHEIGLCLPRFFFLQNPSTWVCVFVNSYPYGLGFSLWSLFLSLHIACFSLQILLKPLVKGFFFTFWLSIVGADGKAVV